MLRYPAKLFNEGYMDLICCVQPLAILVVLA